MPATARTLGRFLAKTRDVIARFQQEMQAAADAPLEVIARERGRLSEPIRSPAPSTEPGESAPAAEPQESSPTVEPESGTDQRDAR